MYSEKSEDSGPGKSGDSSMVDTNREDDTSEKDKKKSMSVAKMALYALLGLVGFLFCVAMCAVGGYVVWKFVVAPNNPSVGRNAGPKQKQTVSTKVV